MKGSEPRLPQRGSGEVQAKTARRFAKSVYWFALLASILLLVWGTVLEWRTPHRDKRRELVFALSCPDPSGSCVEVTNFGPKAVRFALSLNGRGFVESVADIAREAAAIPDDYRGDPPHRKVWRYTRSQVVLSRPVSRLPWYNHPCLLVNSTGFAFCDDMATMNYFLWQQLGYKSRCWFLSGHVVSEVLVGGRWEMYDSDMGICYLRPDGQVAGVQELAENPAWLTGTSLKLRPLTRRTVKAGQAPSTVAIYASKENNTRFFPRPFGPLPFQFVLPPGGSLRFPLPPEMAGTGEHYGDDTGGPAECAFLELEIPSGWSGCLPMPLILQSAAGPGEIRFIDRWLSPDSSAFRSLLHSKVTLDDGLEVRSEGTFRLFYYVNPRRFRLNKENVLILSGERVGECRARLVPNGSGDRATPAGAFSP